MAKDIGTNLEDRAKLEYMNNIVVERLNMTWSPVNKFQKNYSKLKEHTIN